MLMPNSLHVTSGIRSAIGPYGVAANHPGQSGGRPQFFRHGEHHACLCLGAILNRGADGTDGGENGAVSHFQVHLALPVCGHIAVVRDHGYSFAPTEREGIRVPRKSIVIVVGMDFNPSCPPFPRHTTCQPIKLHIYQFQTGQINDFRRDGARQQVVP